MLQRLQGGTTAAHVANCYPGLIDALVIDEEDADDADAVSNPGVRPIVTHTLMHDAPHAGDSPKRHSTRSRSHEGRHRRRDGCVRRALAKRLHEIGKDEVLVGSRDAERAQEIAAELGVTAAATTR